MCGQKYGTDRGRRDVTKGLIQSKGAHERPTFKDFVHPYAFSNVRDFQIQKTSKYNPFWLCFFTMKTKLPKIQPVTYHHHGSSFMTVKEHIRRKPPESHRESNFMQKLMSHYFPLERQIPHLRHMGVCLTIEHEEEFEEEEALPVVRQLLSHKPVETQLSFHLPKRMQYHVSGTSIGQDHIVMYHIDVLQPRFNTSAYSIRRRYSDFYDLYHALERGTKDLDWPSFPFASVWTYFYRHDGQLLEERMTQFQHILTFIQDRKALDEHPLVEAFLGVHPALVHVPFQGRSSYVSLRDYSVPTQSKVYTK